MKIVLIGAGNVATVFGTLLKQAGNTIEQVYSRNAAGAAGLAIALNATWCSTWEAITHEGDVYIVAISDKGLYELDRHLQLNGRVVVHTAGSVPKAVLKNVSSRYGVLYPLQSLRREMPVITAIPLLIDASDEATMEKIRYLAGCISGRIAFATDAQRLKTHVAAVFVNNFVNHLYAVAEDFCIKEGIAFSLLLPLAEETVRRLEEVSPQQVPTGPAVRNDQVTISSHLELLKAHPDARALYAELTASIIAFYHKAEK